MSDPRYGLFCCICFVGLTPDTCYKDENGDKWDMCEECGKHECGEGRLRMSELLLGCGQDRTKRLWMPDYGIPREWTDVYTVDINRDNDPDFVWDLNSMPWPFEDSSFTEVHAYEVMEHLGQQGDYETFFDHFYEIWRILVRNGVLVMTLPRWDKLWAWSDPGHTRIISEATLTFLDRSRYDETDTTRTDYRFAWKGDLRPVHYQHDDDTFVAVLRAIKDEDE